MTYPTQELPPSYLQAGTMDITKDKRLALIMNVAALVLVALAGWLFFQVSYCLRPEDTTSTLLQFSISSLLDIILFLVSILIITVVHVVLHEGVHGFFFWLFTHSRPRFAFHWTYAYAAAPDWYIPQNAFLITTLAPLVLISLLGVLLIPYLPAFILPAVWYILTMNGGGSIGDIIVAIWILRQSPHCYIQDKGDAITLYLPDA